MKLIQFLNLEPQIEALLAEAQTQGIIHETKRFFANIRTLCFFSLKLEIVSFECINWVLTSLKQDEMTPSEKAIISRIKEAFALKINPTLWEFFLDYFLSSKKFGTVIKPPLRKNKI